MPFLKTPEAARKAGIPATRAYSLLRNGKLDPLPEKDGSGDYVWQDADVKRLAEAAKKTERRK